jgi:hypothetical protein
MIVRLIKSKLKEAEPAREKAPVMGVDLLRTVWGIDTAPAAREMPPPDVVTNIYATGSPSRAIPRRARPGSRRSSIG